MIKNFLIAGDQHGNFNNLIWNIDTDVYNPKETAIIVLGDAGINYYLNGKDNQLKNILMQSRYTFYILRGNHEERPERIKNMRMVFDDTVENFVYMQDAWDRIKYFIDGNIYNIKNYRCLTIGGAYSIDKYCRQNNRKPVPRQNLRRLISQRHTNPFRRLQGLGESGKINLLFFRSGNRGFPTGIPPILQQKRQLLRTVGKLLRLYVLLGLGFFLRHRFFLRRRFFHQRRFFH